MAGLSPNANRALRLAMKSVTDGDILYNVVKNLSASAGTAITLDNGFVVTTGGGTITAGGLTITAGGLTVTAGGLTVTAGTTAITTADGLTVGGVIVPQTVVLALDLWSHASLTTRQLFYAQTDAWTVTGIVYEPDIAEGTGSVVCTVCKVTGNSVAVAATTPMCTAFAVTGTAGTPVVATLTSTAADLVLAATNKIGCIFSGGDSFLDTGRGRLYIKMKRS